MLLPAAPLAAENSLPPLEGRVLFLGDSITHDGRYIAFIESWLREYQADAPLPELINLGLPSETLSGLSEPDHPFPRPNVHERLNRALERVSPDLVVVCYGMNDGIYHPFSEERFAAYRDGVERLIEKVAATGAPLVLMTPPPFDPEPPRKNGKLLPKSDDANYSWKTIYENYDTEVLARYAAWIREQAGREGVAGVIDLHTPVNARVADQRTEDPEFTMSKDGVHVDETGQRLLAEVMLKAWGKLEPGAPLEVSQSIHTVVAERQKLLHAAWLSHVGHQRPGVNDGLPLAEAQAQARELWQALANDLAPLFPDSETPAALFNGRDLEGWNGWPKFWSVEEGVIVGRNGLEDEDTATVPSSTYLFSADSYRDFRLLLDVKQTVSPEHSTMHSAVAALGERFTDKGGNEHGFRGPLLMFCHDWGIWDAYRRNRIEPAGQKGPVKLKAENTGDWNRIEILVIGNRLRFAVNGTLVFDFTDDPENLQASPIGLQLHSNKRPQEYRFRGLTISEDPEDRMVTVAPGG